MPLVRQTNEPLNESTAADAHGLDRALLVNTLDYIVFALGYPSELAYYTILFVLSALRIVDCQRIRLRTYQKSSAELQYPTSPHLTRVFSPGGNLRKFVA